MASNTKKIAVAAKAPRFARGYRCPAFSIPGLDDEGKAAAVELPAAEVDELLKLFPLDFVAVK